MWSTTPTGWTPPPRGRSCSAPAGWGGPGRHGVRRPGRCLGRPSTRRVFRDVLTGLEPDAARALLDYTWATHRQRRSPGGSSWRRAATRWPCWSCPASSPPPSSGAPRPYLHSSTSPPMSSRCSSTGAAGCRHQCSPCCCWPPRTTPASSTCCGAPRPASVWRSRPWRPPWTPGCSSATRRRSRCATRWCVRRSTRPRRGRTGAGPTGPWPRHWPARGTRPRGLASRLRRRRPRPGAGHRP